MTIYYSYYGEPEIGAAVSSVVPGYLSLRVNFASGMINNDALLNPDNYTFDVLTPTSAFDLECISVTAEIADYPTYIDLELTDCTDGKDYTFIAEPNVLQNFDGDYIGGGANTADYVGVSEDPEILSMESISSTSMRINFTKSMGLNNDIINPVKYVFNNNLRTLSVDVETISSIIVTTSKQTPSTMYDLTVV